MAQKIQVLLTDDLSGDEAQETVTFALDGSNYEIDLTTEHANELREKLQSYISHGRRVRSGTSSRSQKRAPAARGADSRKIREWAIGNGFTPSARGRISQEILEAYAAAQK